MSVAKILLMKFEASLDLKYKLPLIGASGVGFKHTSKLGVKHQKYSMASPDIDEWQVEVDKDHNIMVKNNAWEIVPKSR